jgi:hypothetical protein
MLSQATIALQLLATDKLEKKFSTFVSGKPQFWSPEQAVILGDQTSQHPMTTIHWSWFSLTIGQGAHCCCIWLVCDLLYYYSTISQNLASLLMKNIINILFNYLWAKCLPLTPLTGHLSSRHYKLYLQSWC